MASWGKVLSFYSLWNQCVGKLLQQYRPHLALVVSAACFHSLFWEYVQVEDYFFNLFSIFRVTCAALTKIKNKLERHPAFSSPQLCIFAMFYHWNHQGIFIIVPTFMPASRPGMLNIHNFMGRMRELNFACCSFCTMRSIKALFQPRLAY